MSFFLFLLLLSITFSQSIQHEQIISLKSNESINLSIFIDDADREIYSASLMYKNINQTEYLVEEMILTGNNVFSATITDHFTDKLDIEYFFIVEFEDGGVISNPIQNSYVIDIIDYKDTYWENLSNNQKVDLLILSPLPNAIINEDNLIIAASMFSIKHIDINNIKILVDGKDFTADALITENFISLAKSNLSSGQHKIRFELTDKFGLTYDPYEWNFSVIKNNKKTWFNQKLNQRLKYWSSYSHSNIDSTDIEYYDHNLVYDINLNWLKIKTNVKLSSLENIYEQPRNRYSLSVSNEHIKLELGDFYPLFNNYMLSGNRVRGFNFNSKYKFLSINLIKGELQRAVQGDPNNNSIYISNYSVLVDTLEDLSINNIGILTIDRDNYNFKRELTGLKLGFNFTKKILWNLNVLKVKDNINSVYSEISNPQLEINEDYSIDGNNYIMNYNDFLLNYNSFINDVDSINYLTDNWSGDKPKDNLIIGSELLLKLDEGKTLIHSEINLSMLNENLWESITSSIQLDTLGGDDLDGKFMGSIQIPEQIFKYNDIFQLGFNQSPIFPIDLTSNNQINALLNMPSVIYEFDSQFNYGKHSIKYLYEKIGPQFNSLGNLYIQSNMIKKSFSDRIRLFENKLYVHLDYTKQKEGLDLEEDNSTQTNTGTFSLSLYPGANMPNINIGFSNQDRFNDLQETYSDEDCETDCTLLDDREHTYTSNYNFSINSKIIIIKEHNINFSIFISDKEDILIDKKIALDPLYYSPRSHNDNRLLSILTKLNNNWNSNLTYNISNFNNGNDNIESLNYYQEQKITSMDLSLEYMGHNFLDRLKLGFNNINGIGYQKFIYYNFKLSASHKFLDNLRIIWNYNYHMKWISNDNMYKDSIFKMKLAFNL